VTGSEILAKTLRDHGVEVIFFLMGGPMTETALACEEGGIRMIDVRHEQAAAMMAHAYARMRRSPAVCMACSGPGTVNLMTGVANAWVDSAPVIAIGGSSMISQYGKLGFQETDQVALFKPITKWAERCYDARRIPELLNTAFRTAFSSRPGPVYLDMPGDVLYEDVLESDVRWREFAGQRHMPLGTPSDIDAALGLMRDAERPVLISGSGVIWSNADQALREFVDRSGMPFWSTPQARGVIADDHPLSFLGARSVAFRECDLIVEVATRQSHVINFASPPRWSRTAKVIQIDIDSTEIGRNRPVDVGIVGDARSVLQQLLAAGAETDTLDPVRYFPWVSYLREENDKRRLEATARLTDDESTPMHPLRLCRELSDWLPPDAVLVVDGNEILNYARQSIEFHTPRSLNSGPYGCMGVGLPFALGAKTAVGDATVVVLHGDGSFGMNAMEMDTALRHNLPVICVISNNGGWTASDRYKVGRELGFTRYERMFAAIGCHAAYVERPSDIRGALDAAEQSGKPAIINVITDPAARASSAKSTVYET
jgi:thiamine pyrophosphate-dependent acetolactate synthase large subunit-like protein